MCVGCLTKRPTFLDLRRCGMVFVDLNMELHAAPMLN